jgi:hypothetical protein
LDEYYWYIEKSTPCPRQGGTLLSGKILEAVVRGVENNTGSTT